MEPLVGQPARDTSARSMILEVIAVSAGDVTDAVRYGADRVELVTGIAEGGLTPSLGLLEVAVQAAGKTPVYTMVRPHSRSFVYDNADVAVMLRDVAHARHAGAAGIVSGALTPDGDVDTVVVERLLEAAAGLDVTFHRAFDEAREPFAALKTLSRYPPVSRILTSGGTQPAPQMTVRIRELIEAARRTHLRVLAGHGLRAEGLGDFVRATGVTEVHFGSGLRRDGTFASRIDPDKVAAVRDVLDGRS